MVPSPVFSPPPLFSTCLRRPLTSQRKHSQSHPTAGSAVRASPSRRPIPYRLIAAARLHFLSMQSQSPIAQGLLPPPCFTFCTTPSHRGLAKRLSPRQRQVPLCAHRARIVQLPIVSSRPQCFPLRATPSQRPMDKCLIAGAGFHFVRTAVHSSQSPKSQSHRRLPLCVQLPPTVSSPLGSRPLVFPSCTTTLSCLPIASSPDSTVVFHFSSKLCHTPIAQGLITTAGFTLELCSFPLSPSKVSLQRRVLLCAHPLPSVHKQLSPR